MKKLVIVLAGLVIVVAVVIYIVIANLGSIIVAIVEEVGTEVTKVEVELEGANVSFTSGKGSLSGLSVGNPAGFKTDDAFELEEVSVTVDTASLDKDIIVVKSVVIDKPHVTYEFGDKGSNIDQIQKNVEQSTTGDRKSGKPNNAKKGKEKKLIIENLYIRNGKIDISGGLLGKKKMGTSLPTIHLTNIGKEGGKATGATPAEVAKKVIEAISKQTSGAVGSLSELKNLLGNQLGTIGKGAEGAAKSVTEGAGNLLNKGKGLFGK